MIAIMQCTLYHFVKLWMSLCFNLFSRKTNFSKTPIQGNVNFLAGFSWKHMHGVRLIITFFNFGLNWFAYISIKNYFNIYTIYFFFFENSAKRWRNLKVFRLRFRWFLYKIIWKNSKLYEKHNFKINMCDV